jgi:hypothetical protein
MFNLNTGFLDLKNGHLQQSEDLDTIFCGTFDRNGKDVSIKLRDSTMDIKGRI